MLGRADGTRLVGPALEIVVDGLFDPTTKYDGSADFRLPAELDEADAQGARGRRRRGYDALGCAGVARVDFFLTDDGLVLNEVNTMPGMTEQSQVPKMFAAAGLAYPELLDELVEGALASAHGGEAPDRGPRPAPRHRRRAGAAPARLPGRLRRAPAWSGW